MKRIKEDGINQKKIKSVSELSHTHVSINQAFLQHLYPPAGTWKQYDNLNQSIILLFN